MVGPNGSGKSNVVDALAWVMGEQGAKTLRGGKMEDVIFAGAGDRKPLGRAEVTLTIDNSDGALPIDYSEVSVTRRMFRDGASEYEINGARARLMDIQELLSDSGIGREMHVIVGQGRLSQILESRPEERRAFIEEAAGVLKHRRRKEKAQRKLVGMQANLDRLTDLTTELGRQLKPLARQAEAARRAQTVQAELRDARLKLAADELVRLSESLSSATSKAEMLAEQVTSVTQVLEESTETQLELDAALTAITAESEAAQKLWFELSALAERVSATIRIAADRASSQGTEPAYQGPDPDDLERQADAADEERDARDAAQEDRQHGRLLRHRLDEAREVVDGEVVLLAGLDVVPLAQERLYLALHLRDLRRFADLQVDHLDVRDAEESLLLRHQGHDDHVVLVLSHGRLPLAGKHANDLERLVVDADVLPDRVLAAEEVRGDGRTDDGDALTLVVVGLRDEGADRQRERANRHVLGRHAHDDGVPVLIAVDDLIGALHDGRNVVDVLDLLLDRYGIVVFERLARSCRTANTTRVRRARRDDEHVAAETRHRVLNVALDPHADGDHGDNGGDANDDAEHGEDGAHFVRKEFMQGDGDAFPN